MPRWRRRWRSTPYGRPLPWSRPKPACRAAPSMPARSSSAPMADAARRRAAYRRGHAGERLAALRLLLTGYRILARRYRTRVGEIDLIARRGDVVAFVEVKRRDGLAVGLEAV